jgi:hypothetical protein
MSGPTKREVWPDDSLRIPAPPSPVPAALLADPTRPAGGIAEPKVPPAAQPLRDHRRPGRSPPAEPITARRAHTGPG